MHRLPTVVRATLICVAAVGLFATPRAAAQTYVLNEFDTGGADLGRAYGINTTGQIVGWNAAGNAHHSAHWLNDVYTDLHGTVHFDLQHPYPLFNQGYSEAYAISDAGQIVGTARTSIRCEVEIVISNAFVVRPAVLSDIATPLPGDALTNLGTLGHPCYAHDSAAVAISNANHIVGWADLDGGSVHAFLVTPKNGVWYQNVIDPNGLVNDLLIDLGTFDAQSTVSSATAVNDNGVVTGYSFIDPASTSNGRAAYHAFRIVPNGGDTWFLDDGSGGNALMEDLGTLGGTNSWGRGVNNAGQIVGESGTADGDTHAFLWQNGVIVDLGTLGGDNSSASRINDNGDIAGWAEVAGGERHAAVWINGQIHDLNKSLLPTTAPKSVLAEARDINENGQIAGWGSLKSGTTRVDTAFMARVATEAEITAAEATIAGQGNDAATSDSSSSSSSDSSANSGDGGGSFSGVPLVNSDAAVANSTVGSDSGDGTTPSEDTTATTPMMCGFGAVGMLPVTMLGMCLMRRRR